MQVHRKSVRGSAAGPSSGPSAPMPLRMRRTAKKPGGGCKTSLRRQRGHGAMSGAMRAARRGLSAARLACAPLALRSEPRKTRRGWRSRRSGRPRGLPRRAPAPFPTAAASLGTASGGPVASSKARASSTIICVAYSGQPSRVSQPEAWCPISAGRQMPGRRALLQPRAALNLYLWGSNQFGCGSS